MTDQNVSDTQASDAVGSSSEHEEQILPEKLPEHGWKPPTAGDACHSGGFGRLVVKRNGAVTDIEFPLSPPATIGRFDPGVGPVDVDLGSMPEGSYVSRKHAKITCEDGKWEITDLGSSNGTFLLRDDFERVETAEIGDGQEIALGNARFVFHLSPVQAATESDAQS